MNKTMRGADILVESLLDAGIRTVFTLSGNHVMSIFDAAIGSAITLVHTRHEAAAVSMADAYARMSGTVGVALVTGGAGHVNALSALCSARAGETPLLLLSGHAPLAEYGNGAFQELDQAALAAPLTKASWTVQSIGNLAHDLARGLRIARSGRPGPVHISLPSDVLEAQGNWNRSKNDMSASDIQPLAQQTARTVIEHLRGANRPLIIAPPALCTVAGRIALGRLSRLGMPVIPMESPRGLNDPSLGRLAELLPDADLVLLLGKALDFTLDFGSPAVFGCRWMIIDPDPDLLDRAVRLLKDPPEMRVVADPMSAIDALLLEAGEHSVMSTGWLAKVATAVAYRPTVIHEGTLNSAVLCSAVAKFLRDCDRPVFVSDGGEIGQWAQALISVPDRIINGVAGAIGPSIPFAIGAKIANPNRTVLAVLGDGTFGFHMAEFETAVRHGVPFITVVGNDGFWNAERQLQRRKYGDARAVGCSLEQGIRYDQVVAALGGHGEFVESEAAIIPALRRALESSRPSCVNVIMKGLPAPAAH
jgi:acetolactate synthase-1/2/3 large subunit